MICPKNIYLLFIDFMYTILSHHGSISCYDLNDKKTIYESLDERSQYQSISAIPIFFKFSITF